MRQTFNIDYSEKQIQPKVSRLFFGGYKFSYFYGGRSFFGRISGGGKKIGGSEYSAATSIGGLESGLPLFELGVNHPVREALATDPNAFQHTVTL